MKKRTKIIIIVVVVLLLLLVVPKVDTLNDGGTKIYKSLLPGIYEVQDVHKINKDSKDGFEKGTIVKIFNNEIVNDVSYEAREVTEQDLIELHTYVTDAIFDYYKWDNYVDSTLNLADMKLHIVLKDNSEEQIKWFKENISDSIFIVFDSESVEK